MALWKDKRPAEKSAAPLLPSSETPVLEEIRDLLKQQTEDMRWLREKLERANLLGT